MSLRVSEYVAVTLVNGKPTVQCAKCKCTLCEGKQSWKNCVPRLESPVSKAGPRRSKSGNFKMREYICPNCATTLDVEVAIDSDPPLQDEIRLETLPRHTPQ